MTETTRTTDVVEMSDATRLEIAVFRAAPSPAAPVVLCMPAMGVQARAYVRLAQGLASAGLIAVTADLRGHGLSPVRASRDVDFGYHDMIAIDLAGVVGWAHDRHPGSPVFMLGHSLGGQLAALYAGAHPGRLAGLVLVAACSVDHRGWSQPHRLGALVGTQAASLLATIWGHFPGKTFRFAGAEARTVMRDWARNGLTGRYDLAHTDLDYERLLGTADLAVLGLTFEGDILAPERACANLWNKMGSAEVSRVRFSHETQGRFEGHFGWLRGPDFLVEAVVDWMGTSAQDRGKRDPRSARFPDQDA